MTADLPPWLQRWARAIHRDLGYLLSALLVGYCLSGLALNHVDDWNPDFVIEKRTVDLGRTYTRAEADEALIASFSALVEESDHRAEMCCAKWRALH